MGFLEGGQRALQQSRPLPIVSFRESERAESAAAVEIQIRVRALGLERFVASRATR